MEKRIRPWINKKIIEYIGEPEPTLVDFICSKVMAGSSPQGILDDVQMVIIIHFFAVAFYVLCEIHIMCVSGTRRRSGSICSQNVEVIDL